MAVNEFVTMKSNMSLSNTKQYFKRKYNKKISKESKL